MKREFLNLDPDPYRALRIAPERPPLAELHDAVVLAVAAAAAVFASPAGALPL